MAKKKKPKAKVTKHIHRGTSLGFGRDKARKAARPNGKELESK